MFNPDIPWYPEGKPAHIAGFTMDSNPHKSSFLETTKSGDLAESLMYNPKYTQVEVRSPVSAKQHPTPVPSPATHGSALGLQGPRTLSPRSELLSTAWLMAQGTQSTSNIQSKMLGNAAGQ